MRRSGGATVADEYTPTTGNIRFTVRYVEAQQESGPHRPAMPAHWVIEDGLTIVARPVDIHVHDLPAHDRAVKAEAWGEGWSRAVDAHPSWWSDPTYNRNPYAEEATDDHA